MTGTIIQFPFQRDPAAPPENLEQVRLRVDVINEVFVEAVTDAVFNNVMDALACSGFETGEDEEGRTFHEALLYTSIKSLAMFSRGIHHPFQDLAPRLFRTGAEGFMEIDEEGCDEAGNS